MGLIRKLLGKATNVDLTQVGSAFDKAASAVDRFKFTGDNEAQFQHERAKVLAELDKAQIALNAGKRFSFRDAVGWACAASFTVMYAITPAVALLRWSIDASFDYSEFQGVVDVIYGPEIAGAFLPVLVALLGLGAYRSYDKKHSPASGVNRKNMKAVVKARVRMLKAGIPDDEAVALVEEMFGE